METMDKKLERVIEIIESISGLTWSNIQLMNLCEELSIIIKECSITSENSAAKQKTLKLAKNLLFEQAKKIAETAKISYVDKKYMQSFDAYEKAIKYLAKSKLTGKNKKDSKILQDQWLKAQAEAAKLSTPNRYKMSEYTDNLNLEFMDIISIVKEYHFCDMIGSLDKSAGGIYSIFAARTLDDSGRCIGNVHLSPYDFGLRDIGLYFFGMIQTARINDLEKNISNSKRKIILDKYLIDLCTNNLFIPNNREESFVAGISIFLFNNMKTAVPILIPQMENSIRILMCKTNNITDVKETDSETGRQIRYTIGDIIGANDIKIRGVFDNESIYLINKVFLDEEHNGFNMRNEVMHGFFSDEKLERTTGPYFALALILKMVLLGSSSTPLPWRL